MKDTLADIQEKLRRGIYSSENEVKFYVVCRVLQALGWDIWDQGKVRQEFRAVPEEDDTRVDIALFAFSSTPSVYVEVKRPGGITHPEIPGIPRADR